MRELIANPDAGWLGTQLEVTRRQRTDPAFRAAWAGPSAAIRAASRARLERQRDAGVIRSDVDIDVLAAYLELVREGLVAHLAAGGDETRLGDVLDVVEGSVRR